MDLCQFGNFATSTIFINFHSFLSLLFNVPMSKHGLQASKQIKECSLSLSLSLSHISYVNFDFNFTFIHEFNFYYFKYMMQF